MTVVLKQFDQFVLECSHTPSPKCDCTYHCLCLTKLNLGKTWHPQNLHHFRSIQTPNNAMGHCKAWPGPSVWDWKQILVLCFLGWPLGREGAGEGISQPGASLDGGRKSGRCQGKEDWWQCPKPNRGSQVGDPQQHSWSLWGGYFQKPN